MRLNDIGAARTELSMIALASGILGVSPSSSAFGVQAFTYSIWGMALKSSWMAAGCIVPYSPHERNSKVAILKV